MLAPLTTRLNTQSQQRPKAVLLFGPTAVGKTALTESLFQRGFEIVNADSVQVYRGLDIGSAKPSSSLQRLIPHHLIDIRNPWEEYTVGDFVHDADRAILDIASRGRVALVTGGTAYYFKHLLYGAPETPKADLAVRASVEESIRENGKDWAYGYLSSFDPVAAARINPNDVYRVSRAIEVYLSTGRPLSSFLLSEKEREDVDFITIGLRRERKELEERIRLRVDIMFSEGMYDEMKRLLREGAKASWPAMEGIGYKEFFPAIECGECTISSIKEDIVRSSIRYAKRQMTFFSSFPTARFFHPDDTEGIRLYLESRGFISR